MTEKVYWLKEVRDRHYELMSFKVMSGYLDDAPPLVALYRTREFAERVAKDTLSGLIHKPRVPYQIDDVTEHDSDGFTEQRGVVYTGPAVAVVVRRIIHPDAGPQYKAKGWSIKDDARAILAAQRVPNPTAKELKEEVELLKWGWEEVPLKLED